MFQLETYPTKAQTHFRSGAPNWPLAVQAAADGGIELDDLADLVFYMHHPERMTGTTGKPLRKGERNFKTMAAEWKTWRASAAAVIEMPKPTPAPTPRPKPRKPKADLKFILEELRRLEDEGELTARERSVAENVARELLDGTSTAVSAVNFVAGLATLVKGASSAGATAALGSLSMAGVVLQFAGFVIALDEAMNVDIRIYRSLAAAYGITAWVHGEPTPDRNRAVRRRLSGRAGLDSNWDDAASKARRAIARKPGAKAVRRVLRSMDRRDLARALVRQIARDLPPSRHNETTALRAIAKTDIKYPN